MAMRLFVAAFAAALVLVLSLSGDPGSVSAHEHRTVAENFEFTVGWLNEPAIANQPNAVSLEVVFFEGGVPEEHEEGEEGAAEVVEGEPVEGVEESLTVTVSTGGGAASTDQPLEPSFGAVGAYESPPLIPTLPGDYTFLFTGTLPDGTEVNETFESGPDTFATVADPATLEFPQPDGDDNPDSSSDSSDDDDDMGWLAVIIAIAGTAIAVVAIVLVILGFARNRAA
jgi:hypothetical protein